MNGVKSTPVRNKPGLAGVTTAFQQILPVLMAFLVIFVGGCSLLKKHESENHVKEDGQVILQWKAAPELTFNVYRRSENGNDIRINQSPVKPMQVFSGGRQLVLFQFVDRAVFVGDDYYYTLEEIHKDGTTSVWETPRKETASAIQGHIEEQ